MPPVVSEFTPRFRHLTLLLLLLALFSCKKGNNAANESKSITENHKKMLKNLAMTKARISNPGNPYDAEDKLAGLDAKLASARDISEQLNFTFQKALALLEYGDELDAVAILEKMVDFTKDKADSRKQLYPVLGLAYMRQAERNNCINNHSAEACIMPIQGNGVHQDKAPARKAVDIFEKDLQDDPQNLGVIWLLNVAYMTLGEYPSKVPKQWLIKGLDDPGKVRVKPFTEIASDLHIDAKNRGGGVIVDDFDNDGNLDIVSSAWGLDDPMHYFHNNGDGTFSDQSKSSNLTGLTGGINLLQADYNNDGWMDIFVLRGGWQGFGGYGDQPNSLLRNNGDGTFTDVTIEAGMLQYRPSQSGVWHDFNRDGLLDLFVANETTDPAHPYPCELYINNGDGTFTDAIATSGINMSFFIKGVTAGDYDNDGWPDLFLSTMDGHKVLLKNKGVSGKNPAFEDVSAQAGFANEKDPTFPTWFFDYDNDGWLDIFVCNYEFNKPLNYYAAKEALHPSGDLAGKVLLFHNNGNGTFTNVTRQMHANEVGFAMAANFGDFDNDGWLDFFLSTGNPAYESLLPNRLYKNLGGKDFADVTVSARVGNLQKGHGVAFADLNNNGDEDIYVDLGGAYRGDAYNSSFYLNPGQNNNNWICLKLEGTQSDRCAIGARVAVKFRENGVQRTVYRDVNSGGSFGCNPLRREIGIGQAASIDEIDITWPVSGKVQVLKDISPNQFLKITEGKEGFEKLNLKAITFKKLDGSIPMCAPVR